MLSRPKKRKVPRALVSFYLARYQPVLWRAEEVMIDPWDVVGQAKCGSKRCRAGTLSFPSRWSPLWCSL